MQLNSNFRRLVPVTLPPFQGRQLYMHTFDFANPLMKDGYEDYLPIVIALLLSLPKMEGVAHMTVDEKLIASGYSQRRPGPHVDGCFVPKASGWNNSGWNHYCNNISGDEVTRMPVIVAASEAGCRAWRGTFTGMPASDGDLRHIREQLGKGEILPANYGYLLSADCVHESLPFYQPTQRSFLRIALPNTFRGFGE